MKLELKQKNGTKIDLTIIHISVSVTKVHFQHLCVTYSREDQKMNSLSMCQQLGEKVASVHVHEQIVASSLT